MKKEHALIDTSEVEVLLDSGAFTMFTKGVEISLEEYAGFINKNKKKFRGGQIVLDVIKSKEKSFENWERLRDLGADTIPVFHMQSDRSEEDTGYSYLDKYLKKTDYIAIGAVAGLRSEQRMLGFSGLWDYLRAIGADKTHKFHVLGVTSIPLLVKFPWYSADSANVVKQSGFGNIFIPQFLKDGSENYKEGRSYSVSDQIRHRPNGVNSFWGMPPGGLVQRQIIDYCEKLGGRLLPSIEGRRLRPRVRRGKNENREPIYNLGLLSESVDLEKDNLCTSYELREFHNHGFFNRLVKQLNSEGHPLKLFSVLANPTQLDTYIKRMTFDNAPKRVLLSYWAIKSGRTLSKKLQLSL